MEFENASQRCSWVQVYDEGVKAVLVEDSIVWANRSDSTGTSGASASTTAWPALVSAQLDSGSKQDCQALKQSSLPVQMGTRPTTVTK